jgi:hypothetical protein
MRTTWRTAVLVTVACCGMGVTLGACSSGAAAPATPARLAPSITADPLDLSRTVQTPCTLLRPDQLAQYHLTNPGSATALAPVTVGAGTTDPACAWTPTSAALPGYRAGVDQHSGGLEGLYRHRAALPVFRPTMVSGFPAVDTAAGADAQGRGQCTVEVGVAGDTLLIVGITVPAGDAFDYTDPCPNAEQFAAAIIGNAEGGVA